jgi:hypothetical protein
MSRFQKIALVTLGLTLGVAGCSERPPRSFVQPNVLKKTDLDGKWYYIQTVTDAPVTSTFMFIGNSSDLMKIKFDIQEQTLFARRSYEQVAGSEDAYKQDPSTYEGQPVAAWPITSQFDIIRQYNPTTGEETNQIVESTERPWNQREFLRVNWGQSALSASDISGLNLNFFFEDGAQIEPASYWESDPTKPDALHLERADDSDNGDFANGEANYLDITNKWVITPREINITYEENGVQQSFSAPACLFSYLLDDCASQLVKVKHAFAKISPKHDYQPRMWDGNQMNLFGIWDVGLNRLTYNRQYGVTNAGFNRHAARFNLWQKSYADLAQCNQDSDCTSAGETCSAYGCSKSCLVDADCDAGKHCVNGAAGYYCAAPLPYNARTMRTTPYYAESSLEPFPTDLFDTGKQIISSWNDAVKVAVQDVTGQMPTTDAFVWCHNPVKVADDPGMPGTADPAACKANIKPTLDANGAPVLDAAGNMIYHARQGDPRRSNIFWVNQQQNGGPLGYGPPLFDIETGETVSGQAYIYGAAIDTYTARSRDLTKLLLGKLAPSDFIVGADISTFVQQYRAGFTSQASGNSSLTGAMPTFSQADVQRMHDSMDFSWAKGLAPAAKLAQGVGPKQFLASLAAKESAIYSSGIFGTANADLGQIRRDRLKGTQLEGMMITPDVMAFANSTGGDWTSLSDGEKARVSPLRSQLVRQQTEARLDKMRAFGFDFDDFADEGMVQRAVQLANQNGGAWDDQAIWQQLRKDIFLAVTLHEVGHNMGLRHNFRASWDALNYHDEYWQLRGDAAVNTNPLRYTGISVDSNGVATAQGVAYSDSDLAQCPVNPTTSKLRPRYLPCKGGATSVNEVMGIRNDGSHLKGGVREYQYSSIMDYGAEFNSDLQGLGKYDKAAMKFSYAGDGYMEVFTDADTSGDNLYRWGVLEAYQNAFGFPSAIIPWIGKPWEAVPYTVYPTLFTNGDFTKIANRTDVPYSSLMTDGNTGLFSYNDGRNQLPVVPYFFCSDEFVGNLTCARFDSGADAYEQAADLISRYENFYLMNNFKRDRYTFHSSLAYQSRITDRYFEQIRNQLTWYALLRTDFESGSNNLGDFFTSERAWGNFTVGVDQGMNALGRVITKPGAGGYNLITAANSPDYNIPYYQHADDNLTAPGPLMGTPDDGYIGLISGKYIDTTWDFTNCGYYWADECQTRIGYFIDKTLALQVLAESQAYFTGRDTSTDVRKYAIGYYTVYKQQMQDRLGGLLSGDYNAIAPRVKPAGGVGSRAFEVAQVNWSDNTLTDPSAAGAAIVDPTGGFTLQLYAGLYGLSNFPTTFDTSFIDNTRVFVIGNGEAPISDADILKNGADLGNGGVSLGANAGTGKEWVYITDAATGKQYAAHSVLANAGRRVDVATRMLETFATLVTTRNGVCPGGPTCSIKQTAVDQFKGNLDVMRSLHHAFGYGVYKSDAPFAY